MSSRKNYLIPVGGVPFGHAGWHAAGLLRVRPRWCAITLGKYFRFTWRVADANHTALGYALATQDGTLENHYSHINSSIFFIIDWESTRKSLTGDHGPVNHFGSSQVCVPLMEHGRSVAGLLLASQNDSLTWPQATLLVSVASPHSAMHCGNNELGNAPVQSIFTNFI